MGAPKELCRIFPADRRSLLPDGYVERYVLPPLVKVFKEYAALRVLNRAEGFLRITDTRDFGVITEHSIGDPALWEYDYRKIVVAKSDLARQTGQSTQYVQLIGVTWLRGHDTVYYGTYEKDGVRVEFSGVQSFGDVLFAQMVWTAYTMHYANRWDLLQRVRVAANLDTYREAMDAIELAMERLGLVDICDLPVAVQDIEDAAILMRAEQIMAKRRHRSSP